MTRAATSAHPNPEMSIQSVSESATSRATASNTRMSRNVVAMVYGRRNAAMTGATTMLMRPTTIAAASAAQPLRISNPGRISAERKNATVLTRRETTSLVTWSFGRTSERLGAFPYV